MSLFSLQGKHAIVAGSGRGIGLAIADGFAQSGCLVMGFVFVLSLSVCS